MPTAFVSGLSIHYLLAGGGPTRLCLVHGAGGAAGLWIRQLEELTDIAQMVALDLPGHGQSGGPGCDRIADYVRAVRELLDALGHSKVVLCGHSMGGAVAQAFALAHPNYLAGLVLVGTGARLRVLPKIFELLARDYPEGVRFVSRLAVSLGAPGHLLESLIRQTLSTSQAVVIGDFRACDAFDVMARLGEIRTPTLVICGTDDQLTPPKYAQFLRDHIAGARLVLISGAGHYVQLERPDETTAALREFLAYLTPPQIRH
ncbi:MAG: alpha/beta hydrolase [Candidatus Rokubacteria bacterium]|nr:alpha/beta hydrolase [Candidatus Rokubacteria bacterium]